MSDKPLKRTIGSIFITHVPWHEDLDETSDDVARPRERSQDSDELVVPDEQVALP